MIQVMARITARADTADAVRQVLQDLVGPTRREAGCVSYELFQNDDNPVEFVTVEQWTDSASVDSHMTTPHVGEAFTKAGPLLASPPLIHRFTQLV